MLIQTADDLDEFTSILKAESDHGLALVVLDMIDRGLCDILRSFMRASLSATRLIDGQCPHLATAAARLAACHALGLIDDVEYADVVVIAKLPGCAAGKTDISWSRSSQGVKLCARLTLSAKNDATRTADGCRAKLIDTATNLLLRLQARSKRVAQERREAPTWVAMEGPDWRSTAFGAGPGDV